MKGVYAFLNVAFPPDPGGLPQRARCWRGDISHVCSLGCWKQAIAALFLAAFVSASAVAQIRLTLEQAGSRIPPDLTPAYEGKQISVRGQASTRAIWAIDAYLLPIQDEADYGLILVGSAAQFADVQPGDWIDAAGSVGRRSGMPVLIPDSIRVSSHGPPPTPKELRLVQLDSSRYSGVLVTAQSRVLAFAENGGGDTVTVSDRSNRLDVFLPRVRRNGTPGLDGYRSGDLVRVTGIAAQSCSLPPFDRSYRILVSSPAGLSLLERAWIVPPSILLAILLAVMSLLILWSLWERGMAAQRRTMRLLNAAGEDATAAPSASEMTRKLLAALSQPLGISGVGIITYARQSQTLETLYADGATRKYCEMQLTATPIFEAASAALRNRTLLVVPDSRRSALFTNVPSATRSGISAPPRSAVFVPMLCQSEVVGILEMESAGAMHRFSAEEQTALQHLANQIAGALKLLEQQAIREQLFRTEKLAAAAQLMSGIAKELRGPLESILDAVASLRQRRDLQEPELSAALVDARRACEIVHRLLAFSRYEPVEPEKVELNLMLREIADLHESAPQSKPIHVRLRFSDQSLVVMGSREQLAQVVLNLLLYAEQSLTRRDNALEDGRSPGEIRITSTLLARRAIIEIGWPVKTSDADVGAIDLSEKTGLSLEICQGIVHSHGGELRVSHPGSDVRFQLDLPVVETRQRGEAAARRESQPARQLTVLVVEPEASGQRHVVSVFTALGHRVVPVASAEEGVDLAVRMRFDVAACALRLPGLSWADFLERVRNHVGGVILMSDTYDADFARTLSSSDVFVLPKPVDPTEIATVCETIGDLAERSAAV